MQALADLRIETRLRLVAAVIAAALAFAYVVAAVNQAGPGSFPWVAIVPAVESAIGAVLLALVANRLVWFVGMLAQVDGVAFAASLTPGWAAWQWLLFAGHILLLVLLGTLALWRRETPGWGGKPGESAGVTGFGGYFRGDLAGRVDPFATGGKRIGQGTDRKRRPSAP